MLKITITQETPKSDAMYAASGSRHPSEYIALMAAVLEELILDAHQIGACNGPAAFSGVVVKLREAREKLRSGGGDADA